MNVIKGIVRDKNKQPVSHAKVALLTERFEVIISGEADESGRFRLEADAKNILILSLQKVLMKNFLDFWGCNIDLRKDLEINPILGKIEIFSLIFFPSLDADNCMMLYFRPMSLKQLVGKEKSLHLN